MSDLYDEEEFKQAVRIAWQAHAHWPRRKPPKMDDLRNMVAFALERMAPKIAARALRDAAERTEAETVCCDEYEEFKRTKKRPEYPHHICYWGASHAEALRIDAAEIEGGQ